MCRHSRYVLDTWNMMAEKKKLYLYKTMGCLVCYKQPTERRFPNCGPKAATIPVPLRRRYWLLISRAVSYQSAPQLTEPRAKSRDSRPETRDLRHETQEPRRGTCQSPVAGRSSRNLIWLSWLTHNVHLFTYVEPFSRDSSPPPQHTLHSADSQKSCHCSGYGGRFGCMHPN